MKPKRLESAIHHPSFLALDRAHLGQDVPEVTLHLRTCAECRGYCASLASPGSASGFVAVEQAIARGRRRFSLGWLLAPASLAAAVCCIFLVVSRGTPSAGRVDGDYVGAKGFRSVWIYVKHGTETQLWDGKQSIAPGDRLRLKIDPGSYHHVEVYSLSDPAHPSLLYAGALSPGQNLTLPEAWELDQSPAAEQLFVVFSEAPTKPDWGELRHGKVPAGVAVLPFVLPKTASLGIEAGVLPP